MNNKYDIKEVKRYETFDGALFIDYEEALHHTTILIKVNDILELLGGTNNDICPENSNFSNGDGYYIISDENHQKALELIELFKRETKLKEYHSMSRYCYEHKYFGKVSGTLSCITKKDGQIIRVGQPFYANNLNELGNKIYNKDIS